MKKIILATVLFFGLSAFATVQAQDSTSRSNNRTGTMKKSSKSSKPKKSTHHTTQGSTGNNGTGTMNSRNRRDSTQGQ